MLSAMATVPSDPVARIRTIPDPQEPVPGLAWPTVAVFLGGFAAWIASTALAVSEVWPWPLSVVVNTVASFVLFTVSHEAAHNTISTSPAVNTWFGRFATPMFAPHAGFRTWRFIHMQHHRFTNDGEGRDPDHYTHEGPSWSAPLRWLTIDLWYMVFYLPRLRSRPRGERIELAVTWAILATAVVVLVATGNGLWLLALYLLPIRLAILLLGWAFDYLPHHGLHDTAAENNYRATRNRVGLERLLNPVLLYQNYHLVHHLHPIIPFYRYVTVWRRNEDEYLARDPALSDVRGRELTVEEYRRLRELQEHH
jgi:fatty acid desaturase